MGLITVAFTMCSLLTPTTSEAAPRTSPQSGFLTLGVPHREEFRRRTQTASKKPSGTQSSWVPGLSQSKRPKIGGESWEEHSRRHACSQSGATRLSLHSSSRHSSNSSRRRNSSSEDQSAVHLARHLAVRPPMPALSLLSFAMMGVGSGSPGGGGIRSVRSQLPRLTSQWTAHRVMGV